MVRGIKMKERRKAHIVVYKQMQQSDEDSQSVCLKEGTIKRREKMLG